MVVTSNHEVSAGVDVVLGVGSDVLLGDGGQHHLLHDVLPQGLQGHLLAVLAGHHHRAHPGHQDHVDGHDDDFGDALGDDHGDNHDDDHDAPVDDAPGGDAGAVLEVVLAGHLGLRVRPSPPEGPVPPGEQVEEQVHVQVQVQEEQQEEEQEQEKEEKQEEQEQEQEQEQE